jgi:hypothetical protein
MNRRARSFMVALAALVAGTFLIVYVYRPGHGAADLAETNSQPNAFHAAASGEQLAAANESSSPKSEAAEPASEPAKPQSEAVKPEGAAAPPPGEAAKPEGATAAPASEAPAPVPPAAPPGGPAPKVQYDLNQLPKPIKRMLEHIVVAAQSGDIDEMLPVLEENELPPMLSTSAVTDPIAFLKKASADGQGRDVLAAMLNVFSSGFVRKGEGRDAMYVWPYFAELDLKTLTPSQEVELYRLLPPAQALAMKQSGKYTYYRAGLGGDGVWHYFVQ